jgi:hypothetical protein
MSVISFKKFSLTKIRLPETEWESCVIPETYLLSKIFCHCPFKETLEHRCESKPAESNMAVGLERGFDFMYVSYELTTIIVLSF